MHKKLVLAKLDSIEHTKKIFAIIVLLMWAFGLSTSRFYFEPRMFQQSKIMFVYSMTWSTTFITVYVSEIIEDFKQSRISVRDAEKFYNYINIIAAIISFAHSYVTSNRLVNFLNQVKLFYVMDLFQIGLSDIRRVIIQICIKALGFPVIVAITLVLRQRQQDAEFSVWWTVYKILPWLIASLFPNCFFGGMAVSRHIFQVLNKKLEKIAQEANCMQTKLQMELQKPYYRMQRFCDLADKLDEFSEIYVEICKQSLAYYDLMGVPFICSLIGNLLGITAGVFTLYETIADALINEEAYDLFNSLTNSVFLVISFCEIALQANMSNENLVAVKETGIILQRINLLHADVRFKQSVEAFSLKVFVIRFKIQPMGLFEVNVSLLHDILSAVTSFLLILIQSDLAVRFSLK